MTSVFDNLFDDNDEFIAYMLKNDSAEVRASVVVTDRLRFLYCLHIKDRASVWKGIQSDSYLLQYCLEVKDRKYLWSKIRSSSSAAVYCVHVKNRRAIAKYVTDEDWLYFYHSHF